MFYINREVYGARDEAQVVGLRVEAGCLCYLGRVRDGHMWPQHHSFELAAAVLVQIHRAARVICVFGDDDSCIRAQVQHPEHVTGGQRGNQQFLRIVARAIPAEGRIGGPEDWGAFARCGHFMIPAVRSVIQRALPVVSGPGGCDVERVVQIAG